MISVLELSSSRANLAPTRVSVRGIQEGLHMHGLLKIAKTNLHGLCYAKINVYMTVPRFRSLAMQYLKLLPSGCSWLLEGLTSPGTQLAFWPAVPRSRSQFPRSATALWRRREMSTWSWFLSSYLSIHILLARSHIYSHLSGVTLAVFGYFQRVSLVAQSILTIMKSSSQLPLMKGARVR